MFVKVNQILGRTLLGHRIMFGCEAGLGVALFIGPEPPLEVDIDVEFSMEGDLSWGLNVRPSFSRSSCLAFDGEKNILTGRLEAPFDESVAVLHFCDDVVLVEVDNQFPPQEMNRWIEVICTPDALQLHPTDI